MPKDSKFNPNQTEQEKLFQKRLSDLMNERHETNADLGEKIDCQRQTISAYKIGRRSPDYKTALKIAEHYGVSLDWLIGRDGAIKSLNADIQSICKATGLSEDVIKQLFAMKKDIDNSVNALLNPRHLMSGADGIEPVITIMGEDVSTFWDYYFNLRKSETALAFLNQFIGSDEFEKILYELRAFTKEFPVPNDAFSMATYRNGIKYELQQAITEFCENFKLNESDLSQSEALYKEYQKQF